MCFFDQDCSCVQDMSSLNTIACDLYASTELMGRREREKDRERDRDSIRESLVVEEIDGGLRRNFTHDNNPFSLLSSTLLTKYFAFQKVYL